MTMVFSFVDLSGYTWKLVKKTTNGFVWFCKKSIFCSLERICLVLHEMTLWICLVMHEMSYFAMEKR